MSIQCTRNINLGRVRAQFTSTASELRYDDVTCFIIHISDKSLLLKTNYTFVVVVVVDDVVVSNINIIIIIIIIIVTLDVVAWAWFFIVQLATKSRRLKC